MEVWMELYIICISEWADDFFMMFIVMLDDFLIPWIDESALNLAPNLEYIRNDLSPQISMDLFPAKDAGNEGRDLLKRAWHP